MTVTGNTGPIIGGKMHEKITSNGPTSLDDIQLNQRRTGVEEEDQLQAIYDIDGTIKRYQKGVSDAKQPAPTPNKDSSLYSGQTDNTSTNLHNKSQATGGFTKHTRDQ